MKSSDERKSFRPKINAQQRRQLRAEQVRLYLKQAGRKAQKGMEPNDRKHDENVGRAIKNMPAEDLDRLIREGDEE